MRVLILNQTFHPDVAATAQHMWDLATYLRPRGHEVAAIASRNIYGSDQGAMFPARETIEGIEIIRVGGTSLGKKSIAHRMFDFASFYAAAGWQLIRRPMPDVLIALTSPPMISALATLACIIRRTPDGKRTKLVYHVMDVYPEAAIASGLFTRNSIPGRLFSAITRWTIRRSAAVIALGPDMAKLLVDHYGASACGNKIHVITPWANGEDLKPIRKEDNPLADALGVRQTFNLVYSGNFGVAHDVETILKAIEMTADQTGLMWLFIGGGKRLKELEARVKQQNWRHVRVLPYQPREKLNESLNLADVHLVSQHPAFTGIVVPSKLFGILAVGKPTLMVGPADCAVSQVLSAAGAGVVVANGDAQGMIAAIERLRREGDAMGKAARAAFEKSHERRVCCAAIEAIITRAQTPGW